MGTPLEAMIVNQLKYSLQIVLRSLNLTLGVEKKQWEEKNNGHVEEYTQAYLGDASNRAYSETH